MNKRSFLLLLMLLLAVSTASAQQFARPDSDIVAGGWTASGGGALWAQVDEATPDDATTHDRTSFQGTGDTMELGLSNVTDPAVSTGHIVRARFERSGPAGGVHDICLFQGATQIACLGSTADLVSWATDSFTLTGTEADNITDYTDLRFKITGDNTAGGNRTLCTWAELEVPDVAGGRRLMVISANHPSEHPVAVQPSCPYGHERLHRERAGGWK